MRHINGVYTQRYNRRRNIDVQLFRGRYKSVSLFDGKIDIAHQIVSRIDELNNRLQHEGHSQAV
jgi:hypothetical protein